MGHCFVEVDSVSVICFPLLVEEEEVVGVPSDFHYLGPPAVFVYDRRRSSLHMADHSGLAQLWKDTPFQGEETSCSDPYYTLTVAGPLFLLVAVLQGQLVEEYRQGQLCTTALRQWKWVPPPAAQNNSLQKSMLHSIALAGSNAATTLAAMDQ